MQLTKLHLLIFVITLIFLAVSIYVPLACYNLLPDKYPTHFNLYGEPDSWSDKNIISVLLGPVILAGSTLLLVPLTIWTARVKDPRKVINLPKKKVEKLSPERAEEVRKITVFHLLLIMLLMGMLVTILSVESVTVALGRRATLSPLSLVITALLLLDGFYLTWKIMRLVDK